MAASEPFCDGIFLKATNPRLVRKPAKPIAMEGLHNPLKLAGAVLWCAAGWAVVVGLAWGIVALIRLALGAL